MKSTPSGLSEPPVPSDLPRARSLAELLRSLGARTVRCFGALTPETEVTGTEFFDSAAPLDSGKDKILLVTSSDQFTPERFRELAAEAAAARYAALAVKAKPERFGQLRDTAEACGLAVLVVSHNVSWKLFDARVSQALGEFAHDGELSYDRRAESLFALANDIAELFGGSVAIEDLGRNVLAYSSVPDQLIDAMRTDGILARRVPASPQHEAQYREVLSAEGPVCYPQLADELPRVALAIRAGSIPLGTIWAIDAHALAEPGTLPRLDDARLGVLRSAAEVAAASMLEDLQLRQSGQQPREQRLRAMLAGEELSGTELAELGIPSGQRAALLVIRPCAAHARSALVQLRSLVHRQLMAYLPEVVTTVHGDEVCALIKAKSLVDAHAVAEPLLPILKKLTGVAVNIFVPQVLSQPAEVQSAKLCALEMAEVWSRAAGDLGWGVAADPALAVPSSSSPAVPSSSGLAVPSSSGLAVPSSSGLAVPVSLSHAVAPGSSPGLPPGSSLGASSGSSPGLPPGSSLGASSGSSPGLPPAESAVVTFDRVRPLLLAGAVAKLLDAQPHLRDARVSALCEEDPPTAKTLGVWIAARGNVARTAARLGVHQNTVRHRLARARKAFGLNLDRSDDLLALWLQLRAEGLA